jgi:hypothetical protein
LFSTAAFAAGDSTDDDNSPPPAHAKVVSAQARHAAAVAAGNAAAKNNEGQPLLPQPPKHGYVPMAPLVPASSAGADGAAEDTMTGSESQRLQEYVGQLSVYTAELTFYCERMGHMLRWITMAACAGLVLLLVGVMYLRAIAKGAVLAARLGADAAGKQVAHSRELAAKQLRAYVFTNGAKGEMLPGKNFIVRIEVKNFGGTPAMRLNGWMGVYVDELANERMPAVMPQDFQTVETILPPGGLCYYYAQTSYPITPELKAIASGQKAIFAYGEIRYSDVFEQSHYVRFKIKCSGERNLASGSFDHCMEGNESE